MTRENDQVRSTVRDQYAKIAEAKAVRGRELLDECVGKRITQDAMACVRQAETAEALDACLQ